MTLTEMEKGFQEIWMLFKETDLKIKETDRILEEKFKETDQQFKKTEKELEKTLKAVGDLSGKWGRFVEGLILPATERLFRERGIEVSRVYPRAKSRKFGETMEIDILAVDGEYAVLIEAKSTLRIEHVDEHLERIDKFSTFFPEYADRKLIGAIGGVVIDQEADKYACKKGLFVIVESGDNVKILNDQEFRPKIWG
ncbi:MAG: DUF3782 domain-containing protein [bacterium]